MQGNSNLGVHSALASTVGRGYTHIAFLRKLAFKLRPGFQDCSNACLRATEKRYVILSGKFYAAARLAEAVKRDDGLQLGLLRNRAS